MNARLNLLLISVMLEIGPVTPAHASDFGGYFGLPDSDEPEGMPRYFRLGGMVGLNIKTHFSVGGTFAVSGNSPGTMTPLTDHIYDDGFVRVDVNATQPNPDNLTWYWGYENSSQSSGGLLTFQAVESYTTAGGSGDSSEISYGAELVYGGMLKQFKRVSVGWEFGFGYLPISADNAQQGAVTTTTTFHTYDVSGVDPFPDAPYEGTYNGPGTLINGTPGSITNLVQSGTAVLNQKLDAMLFSFRLGPVLHWDLNKKLALDVSGGAALGFVTGDLEFSDLITVNGSTAVNAGRISETELLYGGFVSAAVLYHVEDHGDIYLGVQYLSLGDVSFQGAGRAAELDLSGAVYFTAGVNWPF